MVFVDGGVVGILALVFVKLPARNRAVGGRMRLDMAVGDEVITFTFVLR